MNILFKKSVWWFGALAVVFLLSFIACDEEIDTAAPSVSPSKQRARPKPKEQKEQKQKKVSKQMYTYSPVGKRDPFRSYLTDLEEASSVFSGSKRKRSSIEQYTLDQLRLTGIITGTSIPMAMVEDPTGKGHSVRIGMRIGTNGGKVSAIMRDKLIITEEFRDAAGRKRKNRVELILPKEILTFEQ